MSALWETATVGRMQLSHRLALAPMTRSRALPDGTPGPLTAEYYRQRASLGLLISEGVQPSDDGQGYLNTPGIYRSSHVAGWREVADAVHAEGGPSGAAAHARRADVAPREHAAPSAADRPLRDRARCGDVHAERASARFRSRAR